MATKIFSVCCLVIALALLRWIADATFLQSLAIEADLFAPAGFPAFTASITPIRLLQRPAASFLTTSGAAVTAERMVRNKRLLAVFQKTQARPRTR
jgi:hypothetical protein